MYNLYISFNNNAFSTSADAFSFVIDLLHFSPQAVSSHRSFTGGYNDFNREKTLESFTLNNDKSFQIADDIYLNGDELNAVLYRQDDQKCIQYFVFTFEVLNRSWLKNMIDTVNEKGFYFGFYTDMYKTIWQDRIFFDEFMKQKPVSSLKLKMHWHPLLSKINNEEVIDIFQNPGHKIMTYGTWLMAAPEMWFGKQSWQHFKKEKIKSFEKAQKIEEINNDLLYVKLFDAETEDYESKDILDLQTAFREHSEMNKIEKELDEICMMKSNEKNSKILVKAIRIDNDGETNDNSIANQ